MPEATEVVSFILGNVTVSAFVTPGELDRIQSEEVADVVLRRVVVVHGDVGEAVPLGDVPCTFIGGEPSPFVPGGRE